MTRSCGPCSACCSVPEISDLEKSFGVPCRHLCASESGSCGVYASRPAVCREFSCAWLMGDFADEDRPDRCGIMFHRQQDGLMRAFEARPNGFKRLRAQQLLAMLAEPVALLYSDGTIGQRVNEGPPA